MARCSIDAEEAVRGHVQRFDVGRLMMTKNIILWVLGVPISVLVLLNLFGVL